MRVLILEDDKALLELLLDYYSDDFHCDGVMTIKDAKDYILAYNYDVALLDRNIDGFDIGMELISHIKAKNSKTGIIVISSYGTSLDKIDGLMLGADDYLDKPFDNDELKARILALGRRNISSTLILDAYVFDMENKSVLYENKEIMFSKKENGILFYLLSKLNTIVSKDEILDAVYQNPENIGSNTIDVTIANIRKKLPHNIIETIKTRGYRIASAS